jgi:hypothetical protein
MKYMLLLRQAPGAGPQEGTPELDAEMKVWGTIMDELTANGSLLYACGLEADDAATTLRAPKGERTLTDGPYAETKEILFSTVIVNVADLDAAVELAAKMPNSEYGSIEIRPLAAVEQTDSG